MGWGIGINRRDRKDRRDRDDGIFPRTLHSPFLDKPSDQRSSLHYQLSIVHYQLSIVCAFSTGNVIVARDTRCAEGESTLHRGAMHSNVG